MNKRFALAACAVSMVTALGVCVAPTSQASQPMKGAPQDVAGTGDGVPSFSPIDEPVIVIMTHDGASNFIVSPIGADGEDGFSWANVIGPYSGTTLQEMGDIFASYGRKNPIVAAEVKADGNWVMQVRKLSQAPRQSLSRGQGIGDQVIAFSRSPSGLKKMTLTHLGSSNFIVKPVDSKGSVGMSLVNEIGQYKGTVRLPSGTKYLWVQADGEWNYSVS